MTFHSLAMIDTKLVICLSPLVATEIFFGSDRTLISQMLESVFSEETVINLVQNNETS